MSDSNNVLRHGNGGYSHGKVLNQKDFTDFSKLPKAL